MPEKPPDHYIDSTILLDFHLVNSLSSFLKLPLRIVTVDIMAADLEVPTQPEIKSAGVFVKETPVFVLEKMGETAVKYGITIYASVDV